MKILFFIALLVNIIFFLWEFNSGDLNSPMPVAKVDKNETKQILLLSELPKNNDEKSLVIAENTIDVNEQVPPLEINTSADSETKSGINEIDNQEIELADATIVEKPGNNSATEKELMDNGIEQKNSIKDFENLATSVQINSAETSIELEEKAFTQERNKEEVTISSVFNNNESEIKQTEPDKTFCYRAGPFVDHEALNAWIKLNKINVDSLSQLKKDRKIEMRYLVYYPAAENLSKSRKNIQILERMGITDYWMFRKGEMKGAISLGLFSNEKRALLLQEKFTNMGLDLKTKQLHKIVTVLYTQLSTTDENFKDTVVLIDDQQLTDCEKQ